MRQRQVLAARDIMTTTLVSLSPDTPLLSAMRTLTRRRISGAPVVLGDRLIGILSEADCLRAIASSQFFDEDLSDQRLVRHYMSEPRHTIAPETGLYRIAQLFGEVHVRRLPVVEADILLGIVSRRDVLRGIERMSEERRPRKRYPDYPAEREPMPERRG